MAKERIIKNARGFQYKVPVKHREKKFDPEEHNRNAQKLREAKESNPISSKRGTSDGYMTKKK